MDPASPEPELCLVVITVPDDAVARRLCTTWVERRLAACANVVPGVRSYYRWEGALQSDEEVMVVLKTTVDRLPELQAAVHADHPYDVPEYIVLAPKDVDAAYARWVRGATR